MMFAIFPNCDDPRKTIVTCAQALGKRAQDRIQAKTKRLNLFWPIPQTIKDKLGCVVTLKIKSHVLGLNSNSKGQSESYGGWKFIMRALITRLQITRLE